MNRRVNHRLCQGTLGAAAGLLALSPVQAQEALQAAQAAQAAAANRNALVESAGYSYRRGEALQYSLGAGLGFEYNDNINLSDNNPEDEFSIRPSVRGGLSWAISQFNRLGVDVSLGYAYYLNDSDRSTLDFGISPTADNNIGLEMLIGDWRLFLYDSFSVRSDPVRQGSVSNEDELVEFSNTLGLQANYDWANASFYAGYAYKISLFKGSRFDDSERDSHLFNTGYQYAFNPALVVGVNASASMSLYKRGLQNDSVVYTAGPFVRWQATEFITLDVAGGPSYTTFSRNSAGFKPASRSGYYLAASVAHQLRETLQHTLSVSKSISPEVSSFASEALLVSYDVRWDLIRDVGLTFGVFYEDGESTGAVALPAGSVTTGYERFGGRVQVTKSFGEKLGAGLSYEFITKDGDQANTDYAQNRVTLSLNYQF